MPLVEPKYKVVFETYGEEAICDRVQTLYEMMESYLRLIEGTEKVIIQEDLLSHAVMDYFAEIDRARVFRGMRHAGNNMILSYEAYWILRRKPLCLVSERAVSEELLFCNEGFVAWLLTQALLTELYGERLQGEIPDDVFDFYDHLYNYIKYGRLDPDNLELMMTAYRTGTRSVSKG